ncbi:MAG: hypothetical protein K8I00_12785 [Candidatus Omnitrophica bacterium]|nr:hypothetical protein [Candidatus Omnitrophota bacterium]
MRRWTANSIMVGIILLAGRSWAHPPSDMQMDYDDTTKILRVEMRHAVHGSRQDYIRKLVVTVPGKEPIVKYYHMQKNLIQFSDELEISVRTGEEILVEAFSKEGGSKAETYTIPEADKNDQEAGEETPETLPEKPMQKGSGT